MLEKEYDVVIIGAGIGGLICACYLVKQGLKVLIVEQHSIPGGYCTSFMKKGFSFDVGVHYLGAIKKGVLGKILNELDLLKKLNLKPVDPSYKLIMPDFEVLIKGEINSAISEFVKIFPKEKDNLSHFFNFILNENVLTIYTHVKNLTFYDLVNMFFQNSKLKSTLNVLLANIGISSSKAAAFSTIILLREYVFDIAYYPERGMQILPDSCIQLISDNGGDVLLSTKVDTVIFKDNEIDGVRLSNGREIRSKIVVSNADVSHTFCDLINKDTPEKEKIKHLDIASSPFMVYLGLKSSLNNISETNFCVALCETYDIEKQMIANKKNCDSGETTINNCFFS